MRKEYRGIYLLDGVKVVPAKEMEAAVSGGVSGRITGADSAGDGVEEFKKAAKAQTMSYPILQAHNVSADSGLLRLKFDVLTSHDMTYMGVLQTAIACGIERFPIPFVLTNCHNSLCTLGGTFNEDDHRFGMGAARKYGGILVPAHQAVIHQYIRERFAGGGTMILGADSHTRYGALGTMAMGEGAGELVKQLLGRTYEIAQPPVVLVYMKGTPAAGVGPQDVALSIIREVFAEGFVKNRIMEFAGPGVASLSVDYRNGIDVMMTESSCISTIWQTDRQVEEWLEIHGRREDYREIRPGAAAYYDYLLEVDLSAVRPMIALPFHPSNAYSIEELNDNLEEILYQTEQRCNEQMAEFGLRADLRGKIQNGRLKVDQGSIAGCAGGLFENISKAADILRGASIGNDGFQLNVYPASQPIFEEVVEKKIASALLEAGANLRTAFCGPCFGAGDVPHNGGLSIRHTTRNFSNREGSRPKEGQFAYVALMDSLSIAATAANRGYLTPATQWEGSYTKHQYHFDPVPYENRVLDCFGRPDPAEVLVKGPNITDIPAIPELRDNLLLKVSAFLTDPVTTTDELIPGGESSSFRSNLLRLAEYALSAKDPEYVGRCKEIGKWETDLLEGRPVFEEEGELRLAAAVIRQNGFELRQDDTCIGSLLYAIKPGDGSAREYAVTCQRVLGGWANICREYATKRYRSNLINWGILPFTCGEEPAFSVGSFLWVPGIRKSLESGAERITAYVIPEKAGERMKEMELSLGALNETERQILLDGCLINYYRNGR